MTLARAFPLVALLLAAAACDNGPSAVETRDRATETPAIAETFPPDAAPIAEAPAAAEPARLTGNRRESVDAKAQRLFETNGADFAARSAEDYLAKAHAFTRRPPAGTETASRPNGDTLFYHAASNTFAVIDRAGVPRTMFKPREGAAYWAEQKSAAPDFGRRRTTP